MVKTKIVHLGAPCELCGFDARNGDKVNFYCPSGIENYLFRDCAGEYMPCVDIAGNLGPIPMADQIYDFLINGGKF